VISLLYVPDVPSSIKHPIALIRSRTHQACHPSEVDTVSSTPVVASYFSSAVTNIHSSLFCSRFKAWWHGCLTLVHIARDLVSLSHTSPPSQSPSHRVTLRHYTTRHQSFSGLSFVVLSHARFAVNHPSFMPIFISIALSVSKDKHTLLVQHLYNAY